jgi:hypothetical protein
MELAGQSNHLSKNNPYYENGEACLCFFSRIMKMGSMINFFTTYCDLFIERSVRRFCVLIVEDTVMTVGCITAIEVPLFYFSLYLV